MDRTLPALTISGGRTGATNSRVFPGLASQAVIPLRSQPATSSTRAPGVSLTPTNVPRIAQLVRPDALAGQQDAEAGTGPVGAEGSERGQHDHARDRHRVGIDGVARQVGRVTDVQTGVVRGVGADGDLSGPRCSRPRTTVTAEPELPMSTIDSTGRPASVSVWLKPSVAQAARSVRASRSAVAASTSMGP